MTGFLTAVVSVAVILGFMILIHEFGHYAVAKLLGVRVEQFAIGFGRRLVGFRRGETDYRINAIPLGGYVKMSGENIMEERSGDPREFLSHSRWHRFLIAIAGPSMNILLAIGLLTGVYMVHYEYPTYFDQPVVIAWIKQDSAAARIGLQAGDRIVRLGGISNPTWEQIGPEIMLSANQPMNITVQRGSETLQKTLVPEPVTTSEIGSAGWEPEQSVIVAGLEPDMPAGKAGIRDGDRIVALDGTPVPGIDALIESLQKTKDRPVDVAVLRDGKRLDFQVQPVLADSESEKRYRIGFQGTTDMKVGRLALGAAFEQSIDDNRKLSWMILELVQKLVQRKVSPRTVEGPIGIARAAGEAASEKGWSPLLQLTAAISLNLGIFNLLPIPILDGGVILLLALEGLMRRDIGLVIKERIYQAAFVFLVLFAVMVIYNDLKKTLPGIMP